MRWTEPCLVLLLIGGCTKPLPDERLGAYRTTDGRLVSVRASTEDALRLRIFETGETRRYVRDGDVWRAQNGRPTDSLTGTTLAMKDGELTLSRPGEAAVRGQRLLLAAREAPVTVDGAELHVRLTLPDGPGPHPAVVIAQGSGDDAATRTYGTPDFFPVHGVASAVYDKRGTGRSTGSYTQNFTVLADDLVQVAEWLAEQPEVDPRRIGVTGYSQGGWIGPLAASRSEHLSFVIANYGMIDSPRAEARLETEAHFRNLGYDEGALEEVGQLTDAAVDVMVSGYRDWSRFDALAERYSDRAWLADLEYPLEQFYEWPHWMVGIAGRWLDEEVPWDYDSIGALDALAARGVPSVWLIASHDSSAPNGFTLAELARRVVAGEPVVEPARDPTDLHEPRIGQSDDVR